MDKGVPSHFKTRHQLIHFLTMAIFTSSCQHAAVNFSQKHVYGFHPNSPSLMRQPAPTQKNQSSLENIMKTLATAHQASQVVAIVHELTTVYPNEVSYRFDVPFPKRSAIELPCRKTSYTAQQGCLNALLNNKLKINLIY